MRKSSKALAALSLLFCLAACSPRDFLTRRLAIDLINGSDLLRTWVDDPTAEPADLDAMAIADETSWRDERDPVLLYR